MVLRGGPDSQGIYPRAPGPLPQVTGGLRPPPGNHPPLARTETEVGQEPKRAIDPVGRNIRRLEMASRDVWRGNRGVSGEGDPSLQRVRVEFACLPFVKVIFLRATYGNPGIYWVTLDL